ncbi:MAG: hypothetical protein U0031_07320, partial [Thermomicrobiales bacterium]
MLVAFSHLRWDFVWQRPQHLLSRFAQSMPVVVVEEPEYGAARDELRTRRFGRVIVVTPELAGEPQRWGFGDHCNDRISRLLAGYLPADAPLAYWYYTP